MSDTTITTNSKADSDRFLSLASLRESHSNLLKLHREQGNQAGILTEIEQFIIKGRTTGALLDSEDDRWVAQSLLDYWNSIFYRARQESPDSTLAEFDPSLAPELDDVLCPYLGLEAFHEESQHLFFGRQRLLDQMLEKLKTNRLLTVVGSSGSGKSSVVLGGLIPKLKAGGLPGSENWHYFRPIMPGSKPLETLARVTRPPDIDTTEWKEQQVNQFRSNSKHLSQLISELPNQAPSVLVVDQFEELFTLCPDKEVRQAFVDNLLHLVRLPDKRHIVILTMRTDFEEKVTKLKNFQQLFEETQIRVTALDASEVCDAIEKPAELVGLKFEDGLVANLLEDVLGETAALPLLQFTLLKLWENRERNRVTWETYKQVGGGRNALAKSADELYESLIPEDQQTAKRILLKMVRPTEGLEVTSNRILRDDLYTSGDASDRIDRVLRKLAESRLIRYTEGDSSEDIQVEITHEALIRNWDRLINWLEDKMHFLRRRRRLTDDVKLWSSRDRKEDFLYRLEQIKEAKKYDDLSSLEEEFIAQSSAQYKRQQEMNLQLQEITLQNNISYTSQYVEEPQSSDTADEIIKRLNDKTPTERDIQFLSKLLQRNVNQGVFQSGRFNVVVGDGKDVHVSDRYDGVTLEQIRLIVQELKSLQNTQLNSPFDTAQDSERDVGNPPFKKLVLDSTTLQAINERLEILEEIGRTGYLPATQQPELRHLKQRVQTFNNNFKQDLQSIAEQGDRLVQETIAAMRLQLDALKLSRKTITEADHTELLPSELECQQAEAKIFQTFVNRLDDSRAGADWIASNMEPLINYASKKTLKQFPDLNASERAVDDFRFSLKQFLEQVSFSLYWGAYEILDSPEIPLVFDVAQYKTAFQSVKDSISKQLGCETIQGIEDCIDYLIKRLQFY